MDDAPDPLVIQLPPPYTGPPSGIAPHPPTTAVIGVDIGGSGIKAAPVHPLSGELTAKRVRIDTPSPATPDDVAAVVAEVVARVERNPGTGTVDPRAPVGITIPAVVQAGIVRTAANIDASWIGLDAVGHFRRALGRPVTVVNDADAAGVAEMRFGAGVDVRGVVLMVTLGTGIGSALFIDGTLVPNTELGHLPLHGGDAEDYAASSVRKVEGLSMKKYARRLQKYLALVEQLLWPDLILIGGGISRRSDELLPHIDVRTPIAPARLLNSAGIVGAAALVTPSRVDPDWGRPR